MNDQLLSLLGLARRAGRTTLGFDAVCGSALKNESKLILAAADASEGTMRKLHNHLSGSEINIREIPYSIEAINAAIGKPVRLISINDSGFAKKINELLDKGNGEE